MRSTWPDAGICVSQSLCSRCLPVSHHACPRALLCALRSAVNPRVLYHSLPYKHVTRYSPLGASAATPRLNPKRVPSTLTISLPPEFWWGT